MFLIFAVCFSLAEVALRILHSRSKLRMTAKLDEVGQCTTQSTIPGLLYTYVPNHCGANSHGYFDYEYSYAKASGIYRIVIIGDSVAKGQGVDLEDSFGKVLETILNNDADPEGFEVEIITLARTGYSTSQELILLEQEALEYSPNLIIWSYVLNDPAHPVFHNANGELGRYYFQPKLHSIHFIQKRLFLTRERIKRLMCEKDYHQRLHCVYKREIETDIGRIGDISEIHGIPVIFLIHPVFDKSIDFNRYELDSVHLRLNHLATMAGMNVLDILDSFRPYRINQLRQISADPFDPWHPNAKGHMIIAQSIHSRLEEGRFIEEWRLETGSNAD